MPVKLPSVKHTLKSGIWYILGFVLALPHQSSVFIYSDKCTNFVKVSIKIIMKILYNLYLSCTVIY